MTCSSNTVEETTTSSTGRRFRGRNFTSLLAAFFFLALFVSGVVLYVTPRGRFAHWTGWRLLGLNKDQWQSVHVNASLIFLVIMVFHLVVNWRPFWTYCRSRLQKGIRISRELTATLVLGVFAIVASIVGLPPFGTIMEAEEAIKMSWEREVDRAPLPRVEDFSFEAYARPRDWNMDRRGGRGMGRGAGRGERRGTGQAWDQERGLGRATIDELAARAGIGVNRAIEILGRRGITASKDDNVRTLAGKYGLLPNDLLRMLEGERARR